MQILRRMKLCTNYPSLVSKWKHYKFVNNNNSLRQCKLVNHVVYAYILLMLGPITMKLDTLMSNDKSSPKQKLYIQVCKQLYTNSLKQCKLVNVVCAYNLLILDPKTICPMIRVHLNENYKFVNNNKQPKAMYTCIFLYITHLGY